jgi:hypothetical protein
MVKTKSNAMEVHLDDGRCLLNWVEICCIWGEILNTTAYQTLLAEGDVSFKAPHTKSMDKVLNVFSMMNVCIVYENDATGSQIRCCEGHLIRVLV